MAPFPGHSIRVLLPRALPGYSSAFDNMQSNVRTRLHLTSVGNSSKCFFNLKFPVCSRSVCCMENIALRRTMKEPTKVTMKRTDI